MLTALLTLALQVGPADKPCPEGAAVASDAETLRALLAQGPEDIWLKGKVRGEFEAARTVRLHGCEGAALEGLRKASVLKLKGDGIVVEDVRLSGSGDRIGYEDGALKLTGKRNTARRLAVSDCLYGVALEQCADCALEDSTFVGRPAAEENLKGDGIKLWEAHGSVVRGNRVDSVRDVVIWYSRHVTLENNTVTHGRYGTHFMYAHDSTVRGNVMRDNVVGIFVMYSARVLVEHNVLAGARGAAGMGIGFKESDAVTLRGNDIVADTSGVYLDFTPRDPKQRVLFEGNVFALNQVAVRTHSAEHGAEFLKNDFLDNDLVVEVDGNGDAQGITFEGNHWADYAGYDLNHDGTGDVAFLLKQPSSDLHDAHPSLKFFHGTAAMALYDAIAQAVPFFGSRLLLTDAQPSMRPHREVSR